MENEAVAVKLEQNLVEDLMILSLNREVKPENGIPPTDADLTRAFILKSHSS